MRPKQRPADAIYDVCVIGGGPAGAAAASLLASWGHSVVMIHREPRQAGIAESLPASTRKPLAFLGLLDAVEAARFHPNRGNVSRWADVTATARSGAAGYHVTRPLFDAVLREHALRSGASAISGAVRQVTIGEINRIEWEEHRSRQTCRARFVLDCSGRTGLVARRGFRRSHAGYRTLALIAEWEGGEWTRDEQVQTVIESYADGWAWSVPLSATRRQCTVMIDPDRRFIKKSSLAAVYGEELQKASGIWQRLARARQLAVPWSCDASLYHSDRTADSHVMLVGDAASFIEPLSSAGVKKALMSGWRAAIVTNTSIKTPTMWSAAADYYEHRERQVYVDCVRRAAAFFSTAAKAHNSEFWEVRAREGLSSVTDGHELLTDADLESRPEIRAAFQRLRSASSTVRFRPGQRVEYASAPAIEGTEIVLREAVAIPGIAMPVRFAGGANLPELIRLAIESESVPALIAMYQARISPVPVSEILTGLSLLLARGLLVTQEPDLPVTFNNSLAG